MRLAQTVLCTLLLLALASLAEAATPHCSFDQTIDCGTFHGAVTPTYGNGLRYERLVLDGVDDHVRLPQVDPFPLYEGNYGFTVAFWVKGAPKTV